MCIRDRLETLPKKMDEQRAVLAKLQTVLDDPNLYAREPAKFAKASDAFAKGQAELNAMEDQWLELEMLREDMDG